MTAHDHVVQAAGTAMTGVGIIGGFVAKSLPYLQFVSLSVGIVVGVLTAIYTVKRIRSTKSKD